jgi:hypothetical protein
LTLQEFLDVIFRQWAVIRFHTDCLSLISRPRRPPEKEVYIVVSRVDRTESTATAAPMLISLLIDGGLTPL